MDKWGKIQKKYIIRESAGIAVFIFCVIVSIWCDWNAVIKDNILFQIKDIEAFSLTVLQIQATVGTLIIAIIALISGSISDAYMGIAISEFYLSIKPWKLNQKILIFISLGECLSGIIFWALKFYSLVFCSFIGTMIAVFISILDIYSAFSEKNKENTEIEAYIIYILETDTGLERKLILFNSFVVDWMKEINLQDKQTYEKYLEIFKKFVLSLWQYKTDESLSYIQKQSYHVSYCLLNSEKSLVKKRGIEFIQYVYDILWRLINQEKSESMYLVNRYKSGFSLLAEISTELMQNFPEFDAETLERGVDFYRLFDSVQRVGVCLKYDDNVGETDETKEYVFCYDAETESLSVLARYLGYYLTQQATKGNIINQRIWENVLTHRSLLSSNAVPEEREEEFLSGKVLIYFNYCYGMLIYGQPDIIKCGLYLRNINNIFTLDNQYQALFYLSVHCYIYYLAKRESTACVNRKTKGAAEKILNNEKVKAAFLSFLRMLVEHTEWLNPQMLEKMNQLLNRYELFSDDGSAKEMIMERVTSDFYYFIIIFMSRHYNLTVLLEDNIDDIHAYSYVSYKHEPMTKALFKELFKILIGNQKDEGIDAEVGLMYDALERKVKEKQKNRYVRQAEKDQEKYETEVNREEICKRIKDKTKKAIVDKFSPLLTDEDNKNGMIRVKLLTLDNWTNSVGDENLEGRYSMIQGCFLSEIEKYLYRRKIIEVQNRMEFSDDKEFMEYLAENDLKILLGSQYALQNKDYRCTAEYKKFLDDYETIYTSNIRHGIALKRAAIYVCLHDINVSIHSPGLKEEEAQYDSVTGKYKYEITSGLLNDFDKEELKNFLYAYRKVINITARISIQVNKRPAGAIIIRNH